MELLSTILIPLHTYPGAEQLSKWMVDGESRASDCRGGGKGWEAEVTHVVMD